MIVSIPFKRDSLSELEEKQEETLTQEVSIPFKRDSLSELYYLIGENDNEISVSIPFKRDSLSELSRNRLS